MKMKTETKKFSINKRIEQEAWACVVMSLAAISELEAQYENKRVVLGFQDIQGMIDFLHLTDLIFAGASMGKIAAEEVNISVEKTLKNGRTTKSK